MDYITYKRFKGKSISGDVKLGQEIAQLKATLK